MRKRSAGVLLFRRVNANLEVLLVHPGGPFWARKDEGAWSIPKGEYSDEEDPLAAAKREFQEETGFAVDGDFIPLGEALQPSRKLITAWALEHDLDSSAIRSNEFELEWPPRSRILQSFPEVDAAAWFSIPAATGKMLKGQVVFLTRLVEHLTSDPS